MVSKANITLYRGDDENRLVKLTQQTQEGTIPVDLRLVQRIDLQAQADDEMVLNLSSSHDEITILNEAQGEFLLKFDRLKTVQAQWTEANFDLQLIYQNGKVKTVLMGKMKLIHDITKVSDGS